MRKKRKYLKTTQSLKKLKEKEVKENSEEKKQELKVQESKYIDLLKNDIELKELFEKYQEIPVDIRDELALFRAVFVKAVRKQDEDFPLEKFLTCIEKLTQLTERSVKMERGQETLLKKVEEGIIFAINNTLSHCPYCYMSLENVKKALAEEIRGLSL